MIDREEMWDVMRRILPDLDRECFDAAWDAHQEWKRRRAMQ